MKLVGKSIVTLLVAVQVVAVQGQGNDLGQSDKKHPYVD